MAKKYLTTARAVKATPQSKPVPGREKEMHKNNAGGYSFSISPFKMLERFLILGCEGGSYYSTEKQMFAKNTKALHECIRLDPKATVDMIVDISTNGRAPSNEPAIYALAICAHDTRAKRYVDGGTLYKVCRIGTHLFSFMEYYDNSGTGYGRAIRRAISEWYTSRNSDKLAFQLMKYKQRNGWSHKDVFMLAHPSFDINDPVSMNVVRYAIGKPFDADYLVGLADCDYRMSKATNVDEVIMLINAYKAPRELVPTEYINDRRVWEALLPNMGAEAMVRNLGNMSKNGVFASSDNAKFVAQKLSDPVWIKSNRIHPIKSLVGYLQYSAGHGLRGSSTWEVNTVVRDAVEGAFYLGFDAIVPTNKSYMFTMDVSGSMSMGDVAGVFGLTPCMASAALALVTLNTEKDVKLTCFSDTVKWLNIPKSSTIREAMRIAQANNYGGTDATLPFEFATRNKIDVDAFIMTTDGESWMNSYFYGAQRTQRHPYQALNEYRQRVGHDVKLVTIAMVANESSIGDQLDESALDCVGFDTAVPTLISNFVGGNVEQGEDE
jgi:60 kDa SS-A/Ro ribonucleoprotein